MTHFKIFLGFSQFGFIHMPLFALSEIFIFNLLCLQEMQNSSIWNAQKSGYMKWVKSKNNACFDEALGR
jgi:hypothetical protein